MELRAARDVVYVVNPGVLDRRAIAGFTLGQCHGLALAVHERTGWPMVGAYNGNGVCQHVLVVDDQGRLVDITGARTRAQVLSADNVDHVQPIDRAQIDRLVADDGWALPDTAAAELWLDQVIDRATSSAEPIAAEYLLRRVPIDSELELAFRWGGMEDVDVLVRDPGASETRWTGHRSIAVPRGSDGLRVVDFTEDSFNEIIDLWLTQRFDRDDARAATDAAAGRPDDTD